MLSSLNIEHLTFSPTVEDIASFRIPQKHKSCIWYGFGYFRFAFAIV